MYEKCYFTREQKCVLMSWPGSVINPLSEDALHVSTRKWNPLDYPESLVTAHNPLR
jgi:hypothetical protein